MCPTFHHSVYILKAFTQTNIHPCFTWAWADHPLFVRPLLLVKSEHRSFAVNRDNRTLWRLQFTPYTNTDLNLNDQAKLKLNVDLVICHVFLPSQAAYRVILIDNYLNLKTTFNILRLSWVSVYLWLWATWRGVDVGRAGNAKQTVSRF